MKFILEFISQGMAVDHLNQGVVNSYDSYRLKHVPIFLISDFLLNDKLGCSLSVDVIYKRLIMMGLF